MNPQQIPQPNTQEDVAQRRRALNVPKKIAEFLQIKSMLQAIAIIIIGNGFSYYIYHRIHSLQAVLIVSGGATAAGILVFVLSYISLRQIRAADQVGAGLDQFQTGTAVTYDLPTVANTPPLTNELLVDWMGPVFRSDRGGMGWSVLMNEHTGQSIDSLIFTKSRIFAFLVGPDDIPANLKMGGMKAAVETGITYSDQGAADKILQFASIYRTQWDDIMTPIMTAQLLTIAQSHQNFSIPYREITALVIKRTTINSGISLTTSDGQRFSFATTRPDQLDRVETTLRRFVSTITREPL